MCKRGGVICFCFCTWKVDCSHVFDEFLLTESVGKSLSENVIGYYVDYNRFWHKRGKKARHDITEILLKVALNAINKPDKKGREMKILTFSFFLLNYLIFQSFDVERTFVPDEDYSRNASYALNLISTYLFQIFFFERIVAKVLKYYSKRFPRSCNKSLKIPKW